GLEPPRGSRPCARRARLRLGRRSRLLRPRWHQGRRRPGDRAPRRSGYLSLWGRQNRRGRGGRGRRAQERGGALSAMYYWLSHIPFRAVIFVVIAVLAIPVARAEGWIGSPAGARRAGKPASGTRLTRLGWGAIGMALLALMSAGSTGNNLLYLLYGTVLSALLLSALAGWWNLRGLEVELQAPGQVFRDSDFPLKIRLRRTGSWPSFGVEALLGDARARAPALRAGLSAEIELK